ncbi:hypothetical protein MycrhDRAFT_1566 [Mycolicibacterium rhodesiae JS60]|nr:hypothetical protein MycrhDRAFT_1566 [Mycolicibacterium rhodesiae JS60]
MTRSTQRFCAATGFIMIALFLTGFAIAGFIVPPSPELGAESIAALFHENRTRIQVGVILCMFGSALLVPWSVVLYLLTRTGAGAQSPMPLVHPALDRHGGGGEECHPHRPACGRGRSDSCHTGAALSGAEPIDPGRRQAGHCRGWTRAYLNSRENSGLQAGKKRSDGAGQHVWASGQATVTLPLQLQPAGVRHNVG